MLTCPPAQLRSPALRAGASVGDNNSGAKGTHVESLSELGGENDEVLNRDEVGGYIWKRTQEKVLPLPPTAHSPPR